MKFEKFVKSLASSGVIYERGVFKERWLASPSVFMLIPVGVRSVTAAGISDMPKAIDAMLSEIGHNDSCDLAKAVMPFADGGIKDCIRIYSNQARDLSISISNDDYSLIEKSDLTEILYGYDSETEEYTVKAMLVKRYPEMPDDDEELVGIIFPVNFETN